MHRVAQSCTRTLFFFKEPLSISRRQFSALAPLAMLAGKLWSQAAKHWNIKGGFSECLTGCQRPWNADESKWLVELAEERILNQDRMERGKTEKRTNTETLPLVSESFLWLSISLPESNPSQDQHEQTGMLKRFRDTNGPTLVGPVSFSVLMIVLTHLQTRLLSVTASCYRFNVGSAQLTTCIKYQVSDLFLLLLLWLISHPLHSASFL